MFLMLYQEGIKLFKLAVAMLFCTLTSCLISCEGCYNESVVVLANDWALEGDDVNVRVDLSKYSPFILKNELIQNFCGKPIFISVYEDTSLIARYDTVFSITDNDTIIILDSIFDIHTNITLYQIDLFAENSTNMVSVLEEVSAHNKFKNINKGLNLLDKQEEESVTLQQWYGDGYYCQNNFLSVYSEKGEIILKTDGGKETIFSPERYDQKFYHGYFAPEFSRDGDKIVCSYFSGAEKKTFIYDINNKSTQSYDVFGEGGCRLSPSEDYLLVKRLIKVSGGKPTYDFFTYELKNGSLKKVGTGFDAFWISK